jgi:serine/threonine protein kinase
VGCSIRAIIQGAPTLFYLCDCADLDLQMPSHILTVYQRSVPSKKFIAKKVREQSNELEIFEFLNTFQPKSEHIISLHESFQAQSTSWAILPQMISVTYYVDIEPNKLNGKAAQVCWGLIKGVAYLHRLYIAHRDIKPNNLVVDGNFSVKIIDFDLAIRVKDEDEEVDDQCGTEGWMAPEVEKELRHSPIKADRWSTGQVLIYLLNNYRGEDTVLRTTARKLTADDPDQRPSMLQVAESLSDVVNVTVKRKALRSLQDTVEVDGENAKPPNSKKLRLDGPES